MSKRAEPTADDHASDAEATPTDDIAGESDGVVVTRGHPLEDSRIVIRPDGEVVIENLSELLAEVASELDPETGLICRIPPKE